MKAFWNERYQMDEFVYGKEPNAFFKEQLDSITPKGRILLPADGEGRNAVYAAKSGWEAVAFDQSESGKEKAMLLAKEVGVHIQYDIVDATNLSYEESSFDAIALVYAHFPSMIREGIHRNLVKLLKPGGHLILEGFNKDHLKWREQNPSIGGPGDEDLLYSEEILKDDFYALSELNITNEIVQLNEGRFHVGKGAVVRLVGVK